MKMTDERIAAMVALAEKYSENDYEAYLKTSWKNFADLGNELLGTMDKNNREFLYNDLMEYEAHYEFSMDSLIMSEHSHHFENPIYQTI